MHIIPFNRTTRPACVVKGEFGTEFGSIKQLKSGRYQARYTGLGRNKYAAPNTFPDKLEALAWLGNVRKEIDLNVWESQAVKQAVERVSHRRGDS